MAPSGTPHGQSRPEYAHHDRTVRVLRLLQIASVTLPILLLAAGSRMAWHNVYQDASDETDRIGDLVYESTSKLFDAQLLALDQVKLTVAPLSDAAISANEHELHDRLAAMLRYLPHLRDLYFVNRHGHSGVDATRYPTPTATDVTGRDYFQYFQNGGLGLFIGLPGTRIMDNLPFVPLAIARASPGEPFNGVISSSVNPSFFESFFRRVLDGYPDFDGRTISLRRSDGALLVRSHPLPPGVASAASQLSSGLLKSDAAAGHFTSNAFGETRIVAWHRLRDLNLIAFTSVPLQSVTRGWLNTMMPYFFFGACSALALFGISVVALRHATLAAAAEQQAAQERVRREKAEEAVRQGQKMEALGKLTGGVAHDFNNLLAVIQGSAELAEARPPERIARLLDNIVHAAQRGAGLTRQLLSFSRTQSLAPRVMDPHSAIPHLMELLQPSLRGDIAIDVHVPADVWLIEVDPGEWEIALLNIVVNARDAMAQGGALTLEVTNQRIKPGDIATDPGLSGNFVCIALRDTGPGIPPDVAARAFEPFFTTKEVGRGTGLGLSQVYGFARQAGGVATIAAGTTGGTTVTLYLPRSEKPVPAIVSAIQPGEPRNDGVKRLLLVEDNDDVAGITIEMIQTLGYDVVHVDRARAALDRLMAEDAVFHLLLTDIVMPDGMNGLELARTVRMRMPTLPIVLVSGYNDAVGDQPIEFQILRKPLPVDQLAQVLKAELGGPYPRIVVDNTRAG